MFRYGNRGILRTESSWPGRGGSVGFALMNVCVIDDDRAIYESVVDAFPAAQWFRDAETFLSKVDHSIKEWVIVADVHLSGIGGIELMGQLQALGLTASVILVCRNPDVLTAVSALRQGAVDFIEKPILRPLLIGSIRRLLG